MTLLLDEVQSSESGAWSLGLYLCCRVGEVLAHWDYRKTWDRVHVKELHSGLLPPHCGHLSFACGWQCCTVSSIWWPAGIEREPGCHTGLPVITVSWVTRHKANMHALVPFSLPVMFGDFSFGSLECCRCRLIIVSFFKAAIEGRFFLFSLAMHQFLQRVHPRLQFPEFWGIFKIKLLVALKPGRLHPFKWWHLGTEHSVFPPQHPALYFCFLLSFLLVISPAVNSGLFNCTPVLLSHQSQLREPFLGK